MWQRVDVSDCAWVSAAARLRTCSRGTLPILPTSLLFHAVRDPRKYVYVWRWPYSLHLRNGDGIASPVTTPARCWDTLSVATIPIAEQASTWVRRKSRGCKAGRGIMLSILSWTRRLETQLHASRRWILMDIPCDHSHPAIPMVQDRCLFAKKFRALTVPDPLNWNKWFKLFVLLQVSFLAFIGPFSQGAIVCQHFRGAHCERNYMLTSTRTPRTARLRSASTSLSPLPPTTRRLQLSSPELRL